MKTINKSFYKKGVALLLSLILCMGMCFNVNAQGTENFKTIRLNITGQGKVQMNTSSGSSIFTKSTSVDIESGDIITLNINADSGYKLLSIDNDVFNNTYSYDKTYSYDELKDITITFEKENTSTGTSSNKTTFSNGNNNTTTLNNDNNINTSNNEDIQIDVEYGNGQVLKLDTYKYSINPAEGYRIWRVVAHNDLLDKVNISNKGNIYTIDKKTKILKVYFISNKEYDEIVKATDNELDGCWDNPAYFYKYYGKELTMQDYEEVYGEYMQLHKEDNSKFNTGEVDNKKIFYPFNNYFSVLSNGMFGIMNSAPAGWIPTVGEVVTGSGTCGGTATGSLSVFPVSLTSGNLAGFELTLACGIHGAAEPYGKVGTYSATITGVDMSAGTFTFSIEWRITPTATPGVPHSGYQSLVGTGSGTFTLPYGYLKLKKTSTNPSISNNNNCYSLAGAIYNVYSDSGCTAYVGQLTTDASGNSGEIELMQGTYYVKEIQAPQGYGLNNQVYSIAVTPNNTATLNVADPPQADPIDIALKKVDKETGQPYPLEKGSLKGAKYIYKYYDNYDWSGTPKAQWTFKTNDNGIIFFEEEYLDPDSDNSPVYKDGQGIMSIPVGSITIQEIQAPTGYLIDDTLYKYKIEAINNNAVARDPVTGELVSVLPVEVQPTVQEQSKRGDYKFDKLDGYNNKSIPHCPFKITSEITGEEVVIYTDENGEWSSESSFIPHTYNTNGGEIGDGIWFGMDSEGNVADADDSLGAFPFGTYKFEELPCEGNQNLELISWTVEIKLDKFVVNGGTKIDNPPKGLIGTIKTNAEPFPPIDDSIVEEQPQNISLESGTYTKTGDDNLSNIIFLFLVIITSSCGIIFYRKEKNNDWKEKNSN